MCGSPAFLQQYADSLPAQLTALPAMPAEVE